jgi:hypothetical protein
MFSLKKIYMGDKEFLANRELDSEIAGKGKTMIPLDFKINPRPDYGDIQRHGRLAYAPKEVRDWAYHKGDKADMERIVKEVERQLKQIGGGVR